MQAGPPSPAQVQSRSRLVRGEAVEQSVTAGAAQKEAKKDAVRSYAYIGTCDKAWNFFQRVGQDYAPTMFEQLGELYNAQGDLTSAAAIFDECLGSRRFDAPALRSHRQAVREAIAAQAPPPPPPTGWVPESRQLWAVGAVAGLIVIGLAYLQLRELRRRRRLRAAGRNFDCPSC